MASALLEELKTVATEVKESQIQNTVGISWATLKILKGEGEELYWSKRGREEGAEGGGARERGGRAGGRGC